MKPVLSQAENVVRLVFRGLLPTVSVAGGVWLLTSELSGWNIILGIPMTVIGMVFLIYTYDEVVSNKIQPLSQELVRCRRCRRLTPRMSGVKPEETVCLSCKRAGK